MPQLYILSNRENAAPVPASTFARSEQRPLRFLLGDALIEKPNHFACSIRALGVHIRSARAPSKPRVAAFMHQPVFENSASRRIAVNGAGVRVPARHPTAVGPCIGAPRVVLLHRLRYQLLAVSWMHGVVTIPMEHDSRYCR